jgi:hypothetical protein
MLHRVTTARFLVSALCLLVLTACADSGDQQKNLGGTLSGLNAGASVTLKNNNNGDSLTLSANGSFQFSIFVSQGDSYTVVVTSQPAGQTCTVANGVGTLNATVTNIHVTCG